MLLLADIDLNILGTAGFTDYHTCIYFLTGTDEEGSTILSGEETVSYGFTGLEGDEGAVLTESDVSSVLIVAVEDGIDDTSTLGHGHEGTTETNQSSGRDAELEADETTSNGGHTTKFTLTLGEFLNNSSLEFRRYINICDFDRLGLLAVCIGMEENLRLGNCEFVTFTSHVLDQYGQMKLTTTADLEGIRRIGILNTKGYVGVQFLVESVTDMSGSYEFTFLSCERRVVNHEVHGDGRFRDLLERNCLRSCSITDGVTDVKIADTGDCNNVTDGSFFYRNSLQTVEGEELGNTNLILLIRVMVVNNNSILIHTNLTVGYLTDTDTTNEFVVVDGGYENLHICIRITLRCRDEVEDGLEERCHILLLIVEVLDRITFSCRSEDEGAVKLFIRSIEVHEELENFVLNFEGTCVRTVKLVNADENRKLQSHSLHQNELGLGHNTFESINYKNRTINHLQDTLNFATEVSMARSIDDVDLGVAIGYCGILGQDGDSTFTLDVVGIHDTVLDVLVLTEYTALFKEFIYESCLTVIDVCNNCNVTNVVSGLKHSYHSFFLYINS